MNNQTPADICCIGHITLDRVVTPDFEAYMPGGTAYYFAKALERLDHPGFRLVTAVGPDEVKVIKELQSEGIDVVALPSHKSVFFENHYGADRNNRSQKVIAKADPFTMENLVGIYSRIYHLGTLLADDFSLDVIKELSKRGKVALDVQGYLRKVVGHDVIPVDYADKHEAMPYISILKANEKEMEVLTGESDPYKAARILTSWGCPEVLLTLGDKGSLIYAEGKFYEIPAYPPVEIVDATGCGDTYMAGYLYSRSRGSGYAEAGRFAAAMCTLKLAHKGPFGGSLEEVRSILNKSSKQKVCLHDA